MEQVDHIKWNRESLENFISNMKNALTDLNDNKNFIMSINNEIQEAWQGWAGSTYTEVMDIDISNYLNIISILEDLINDINASKTDYENCENDIKRIISGLNNEIGV